MADFHAGFTRLSAKSLKDENRRPLLVVLLFNLGVFYVIVQAHSILSSDWPQLLKAVPAAGLAALGLGLLSIFNAQLTSEAKSRLIFLRWANPLPGCEAFSRYALEDQRIDLPALERVCGPFPTDPRRQNALWYRLYKSVDTDPSVTQAHREFLFARDYSSLSLLLLVALGIAAFFLTPSRFLMLLYVAGLVVQFALASRAARTHARRFVTTVLALKASGFGPSDAGIEKKV